MKNLKKNHPEMESKNTSEFLNKLRSQAERQVKPQAMASLLNLSMDDIAQLVYELETHQIELEMQNNELERVQVALEKVNYEYTRLFDDAPVGLISIDQKGKILKSNVSAECMLSNPISTTGRELITSYIVDDDQDVFYLYKRQALASLNRESCELRLKTETGEPLWVRLDSICELDPDKVECARIRLVLIDISEQKKAEADLLMEKRKADDMKILCSELNVKLLNLLAQKEGMEE